MKLYRVSSHWRYKGERKAWHQSVFVIADSDEEARRKFDDEYTFPQNVVERGLIWTEEVKDGLFVCSPQKY